MPCPACGRGNPAGADLCASCGAEGTECEDARPVSGDEQGFLVPLDRSLGVVAVDRSVFGRHEGLFVVYQGAKAGARYALDTDLVALGRDPGSDIFLDDITVSPQHAEVRRRGDRYWIRDVGSLNGTYVNRRLVEECELVDCDEVQIGKFKLVFAHGSSVQ